MSRLIQGRAIAVERVRLVDTGTALEGSWELPQLARLSAEDQVFVTAFVRSHGSIKEMERVFGVSYPTIKARLNRIGDSLDFVDTNPQPSRVEILERLAPRRDHARRRHSRIGGAEMTEERRQILEMLATGKINADEADRLIGALDGKNGSSTSVATSTATAASPKVTPGYLRVMVDAKEGHDDKPVHINVRVPIALLRAGVRLASLIPPRAQEKVNAELRKQGMDLDVSQIKPENINELIDQLQDFSVDIDQKHDDVKIRIYCE